MLHWSDADMASAAINVGDADVGKSANGWDIIGDDRMSEDETALAAFSDNTTPVVDATTEHRMKLDICRIFGRYLLFAWLQVFQIARFFINKQIN